MEKNKVEKPSRGKKLNVIDINAIEYEHTERNTELEKSNVIFANSHRGRIISYLNGLAVQLRRSYDRYVLFINGRTLLIKTFFITGIDFLRIFLYNKYCNKLIRKDKKMSGKNNNQTEVNTNNNSKDNTMKQSTSKDKTLTRGIIGICELLVVASIAYMTSVIVMGTEGYIPAVLSAPAAIYAVVRLFKNFTK